MKFFNHGKDEFDAKPADFEDEGAVTDEEQKNYPVILIYDILFDFLLLFPQIFWLIL